MISHGVVYIAFGDFYFFQMLFSLKSMLNSNPGMSVHILTNSDKYVYFLEEYPSVTYTYFAVPSSRNREYKTKLYAYSPFDQTLHIDVDTFISGSLMPIFNLLKIHDFVVRTEATPISNTYREDNPEESRILILNYGEFNTGVFGFNKSSDSAISLLDEWTRLKLTSKTPRDQRIFIQALEKNMHVKLWPLSPNFNYNKYDFLVHKGDNAITSPVIWHYMDYAYCIAAWHFVFRTIFTVDKSIILRNKEYFFKNFILSILLRFVPLFRPSYVAFSKIYRFLRKF